MAEGSPLDQNDELGSKYFRETYRIRYEKYGPHPFCANCLKRDLCQVANVPGYKFACNERVEVGPPDQNGLTIDNLRPIAPPTLSNKARKK